MLKKMGACGGLGASRRRWFSVGRGGTKKAPLLLISCRRGQPSPRSHGKTRKFSQVPNLTLESLCANSSFVWSNSSKPQVYTSVCQFFLCLVKISGHTGTLVCHNFSFVCGQDIRGYFSVPILPVCEGKRANAPVAALDCPCLELAQICLECCHFL